MDETRVKRIIFRAWRRGFREADLILGPFAETHVRELGEDDLIALESLLDAPDQDAYAWIVGTLAPPPEFDTPLLKRVQTFKRDLPVARGDLSGG